MRVITVAYARTKQVRPYEPERLELTIELQEGEQASEAVRRARNFCRRQFGELPDEDTLDEMIEANRDQLNELLTLRQTIDEGV